MEYVEDDGGTQRQANIFSTGRSGPAAVGGLLLADSAAPHGPKRSMREQAPEPEEPAPDPELGAWG